MAFFPTTKNTLNGLTSLQARELLEQHGPNTLPGEQRRTLWSIVAETLREPMFMLLLAAGMLYVVLGDLHQAQQDHAFL